MAKPQQEEQAASGARVERGRGASWFWLHPPGLPAARRRGMLVGMAGDETCKPSNLRRALSKDAICRWWGIRCVAGLAAGFQGTVPQVWAQEHQGIRFRVMYQENHASNQKIQMGMPQVPAATHTGIIKLFSLASTRHPTATIAVRMNNERMRNCGRGIVTRLLRRGLPGSGRSDPRYT
jgi:hypothetical protein